MPLSMYFDYFGPTYVNIYIIQMMDDKESNIELYRTKKKLQWGQYIFDLLANYENWLLVGGCTPQMAISR